MPSRLLIASILGALSVVLGAFGAHGLETLFAENGHADTWETATLYHLAHAVALLVLATADGRLKSKWTFRLWLVGIMLFSGSLYLLSTVGWSWLGPVTPLGGLAFIAGWIALPLENRK